MANKNKKTKEVLRIEKIFDGANMWYKSTSNLKSVSCADAARKRSRLGHIGIPLCDEINSYFGTYLRNGNIKYILLHCRGTQEIDLDKVFKYLPFVITRIAEEELIQLSLAKGLINPFIKIHGGKILQMFDKNLFEKQTPPFTMMTNMGNFYWSIEFYPDDLLKLLPHAKVYDIINDKYKYPFKVHKIGILTGNGPESGILLWKKINTQIQNLLNRGFDQNGLFTGDLSFPEVIIESQPEMGISMELELRNDKVKEIILNSITSLCNNGATLICIACNTSQYYTDEINEICKDHGARFISIPELLLKYLIKNDIKEFDFIGTKNVTDFNTWSAFKSLNLNFIVHLPSKENLEKINTLAFKVKKENVNESGRNLFRSLINQSAKTQTIVVALTEFSLILDTENKRFPRRRTYIDTLSLMAKETAYTYVEGVFDTLYKPNKKKKRYE